LSHIGDSYISFTDLPELIVDLKLANLVYLRPSNQYWCR